MGTSVPDDFSGMSCRTCKAAMKKVSGLPAISDGGIGINLAGMRNEGMTEQRLAPLSWRRASVSKYGKNEKDMPDGGIITNRTEVKRQIEEEIIGVDQGQFSQIVMIAQGEFRKLLRTETKKRKEILRRIFKTKFYDDLTEMLDRVCNEKKREYEDTRKEILIALKNMECEERTVGRND